MTNYLLVETGGHLVLETGGRIILDQTNQIFELNGTTITHVNRANWIDKPGAAQALDGVIPLRSSRTHVWELDEVPIAMVNLLSAQEGAAVRITTTGYSARNADDYVEYPSAVLESLVAPHPGPNARGVVATFLVRI